jgi:glycosyltransferase involved in cell wall biosynthesis
VEAAGVTPVETAVWVLPNKVGGALNIVETLLRFRPASAMAYHAVLTDNLMSVDTRFTGTLDAASQRTVAYRSPVENLHAVLRRLHAAVPAGGGVLVANDQVELALAHAYDMGRAVVQIVHGDYDYYYDLATRHQAVIDVFVAYSRRIAETLRRRLPLRAADVYHLPFGIPSPPTVRRAVPGPLRVVYVGRLDEAKGLLDLPVVDELLRRRGVDVAWTLIGSGPLESRLREAWPSPQVSWLGALPREQVLHRLADFDVFVLPTRGEGFPVALVEGMGAGLVPVVSDIPSGVPEVVEPGVTGWRLAVGDTVATADAIGCLAGDRVLLESMSRAARALIATRFDPAARAADYAALFARWRQLRRPRPAHLAVPYCTRLDQPWMPNFAVRAVRTAIRRAQGKPV